MAWGAVIGLAVNAWSNNREKKAREKAQRESAKALDVKAQAKRLGVSMNDVFGSRLEPPAFEFSEDDIYRITERLARFNPGGGGDLANQTAAKVNASTVDQLEAAMSSLFGGGGAFERQRTATNESVEQMLAGRLSPSTERALGRRAIRGGASALGPGAVEDQYVGYLGLTTEDVVSRGQEVYRSLYSTYRQALPLVTGADMMPYTTMQPAQGVNFAFQSAVAQYEAGMNMALAEAAPDPVASGMMLAEMRRSGALTGMQLQSDLASAASIASLGQDAAGIYTGYKTAQDAQRRIDYGNLGGVVSRI